MEMGTLSDLATNLLAALIVGLLVQIFYTYLDWINAWQQIRRIEKETDADAALVDKIAKAVRPSIAVSILFNVIFVLIGVVAGAYTPEIRLFLDRLLGT